MVKGSRRRPLTAETGVRFPYELLQSLINKAFQKSGNSKVTLEVTAQVFVINASTKAVLQIIYVMGQPMRKEDLYARQIKM